MNIYTSYYNNRDLQKEKGDYFLIATSEKLFDNIITLINYQDKSLAPSYSIFKEYKDTKDEAKYVERYKKEIMSKINWDKKIEEWEQMGENIVICSYEKSEDVSYRQIIAEHLEKNYGFTIKEYGKENDLRIDYKIVKNENQKDLKQKEVKNEENVELIATFKGTENGFLSNMANYAVVEYEGLKYPTVEHFYQCMKFEKDLVQNINGVDVNVREHLRTLESPYEVKKLSNSFTPIRSDFDDINLKVMEYGLRYKFSNPYFTKKLLATGNKKLQEGNTWNDTFWGVSLSTGLGENNLGKLIEKLRTELQEKGLLLKMSNFETTNKTNNVSNVQNNKSKTEENKNDIKIDFKKIENKFYLAITGHANIEKAVHETSVYNGYNEEVYKKFELDVKLAIEKICLKYNLKQENLVLISGMARGVDEIFALYAVQHNLDLILAVPNSVWWHKNRDPRNDGTKAQAEKYEEILKYVKTKEKEKTGSGIFEIKKNYRGKEYQYANFARNDFMVFNSDGIISHKIDKSPGTSHAVESAIAAGKYLGNIYKYEDLKTINEIAEEKQKEKLEKLKSEHNSSDIANDHVSVPNEMTENGEFISNDNVIYDDLNYNEEIPTELYDNYDFGIEDSNIYITEEPLQEPLKEKEIDNSIKEKIVVPVLSTPEEIKIEQPIVKTEEPVVKEYKSSILKKMYSNKSKTEEVIVNQALVKEVVSSESNLENSKTILEGEKALTYINNCKKMLNDLINIRELNENFKKEILTSDLDDSVKQKVSVLENFIEKIEQEFKSKNVISYVKEENDFNVDTFKLVKKLQSHILNQDKDNKENNKQKDNFSIQYNTDLFAFQTHVLIHGCNCFNTMGAGVAKIIHDRFPEAYNVDQNTEKGDRNKLGSFTFAKITGGNGKDKPVYIVNLYSQYTFFDKNDMFYINEFKKGLYSVLDHFIKERNDNGKENLKLKFSLPAIGLGLANGKIEEVYDVLDKIRKQYKKDNIEVNLCLHPMDKELNKKFKILEEKNIKENDITI